MNSREHATVKARNSQTEPSAISKEFAPGLYLVATPIGHLKDITLRALELLSVADLVLCEDTRVTAKLLNHYGLHPSTLSYNDHNAAERRPAVLNALASSQRVALVSDAGTPLISDPGFKLVREAQAKGHLVTVLPGASSVLAALCLAGLPTDRFFFAGFLPSRDTACRKALLDIANIPATLVFFESARRLPETLQIMHDVLGEREAVVLRELTKLFEERKHGALSALAAQYAEQGAPRGEVVVVVSGHDPDNASGGVAAIEGQLTALVATYGVKEAATMLAAQTGLPRKEIYAMALRLKHGTE